MAGVGMEKFEEYFQKADADRDGRISGAEAVNFLQGSNLPRQVLAQIWMYADQNGTGFLSRPEFYNALKLVTVAQSKRELTKDIVKAALYTPASAKIPPPQINVPATPGPHPSPVVASPLTQVGATPQPSSQNLGFRGPAPPTSSFNQQSGTVLSTSGMNQQLRPVPSSTGMNQQFGMVPSSVGVNQQSGTVLSTSGMNQQLRPVPSPTGMNHQFGMGPSSVGVNQQLLQGQPASLNHQYGQVPPNTNVNPQFFPSQGSQVRPPISMPTGPASRPPQAASGPYISGGMTGIGLPNTNNGFSVGSSVGPATQVSDRGVNPSISSVAPNSQDPLASFSGAKDPKAFVSSGIGPNSSAMFSSDLFSANQSSSQKVYSTPQQPTSSLPTSTAVDPVSSSAQTSAKPDPFEALHSTLRKPPAAVPAAQTQYVPKPNQQAPTQVTSSGLTPVSLTGMGNAMSEPSQISWPKMTRADIQKYAKVFMEVDTDRDGKITGDQARNLFLGWRLPREVLKQIWDLSDQDSDSMLSLREFCVALYLMERYREGKPLPSVIPNSVMLDETLVTLAGPPTAYGGMTWNPASGIRPQQGLPGVQPVTHAGLRPPLQPVVSQADGSRQYNQNAGGRTLDNSLGNQHSNGLVNALDVGGQEAAETTEKVDNKENVLLDSREKLEYYRTKMQDLVLYKSRCDNRLNEITERARADKSEAELLEKKYQEKYKQVAEIHSKLTIEEASFRDIQERKMELQQAITKMEQGGSADGILQVRADRIQSDLEELLKALAERCKKHSVEVKSAAIIELPQGWQPGIPEIAAVWDEDWDKFDDEGFSFDVALPEKGKPASVEREKSSPTHSYSPPDSPSNASEPEKPFVAGPSAFDAESVFSADESKSPRGSPERPTSYESPSKEYSEGHFRKSSDGDAETNRGFDEPSWGDFDNNDDIDSVWGFNTKDPDGAKNDEKYFFGSNDFGASSERSISPHAESAFPKSNLFFEDSVPSTPLTRAGDSPRYGNDSRDPFESFSRYDSFSTQDHASSPRGETYGRFDSISSSRGFDHSSNYSFDDSDPFGSSGPFKVSSDTSKEKF
ncbi:epidermal growth factor receptor substrate 15-like 1 [Salvia hispanica]|uniref:epidermal growth factor receptor substrate 15-like 1 n=1 Tax=Salvia hispanica TaxID=49212 RepID=UPI002009877B|nr:epidermal growth factor receptor substrate 15-like 1 [Salvia hispanica]